ncbi:Crp/Fnr family transcriptional regulator [Pedobacter hartonius]|uniref:cAMP-binding domain of CRP or a regulatory subunit of cAMP-dependent protein kinases n=1 Tax=Pedobacter hartonius TaxID=425514 RepID=A0A1H4H3C2_9SPHI|nr:Crp/Fnr family transcriptional regulator [Pedobacter hartonius]SEB15608.1 cAMP-binding domain of CRP or a regulatory subunit of cAMP-dependent protein kinases [Pedobacter hartonius]
MLSNFWIKYHFKTILYKKGAVIYESGQTPRYVYFIKSGEIRMVTVNHDGKEFIQGVFKAKQYFGEPALLLQRSYLAYTIASRDTELILVDRPHFLKLLEEDRAFSMNLIETLSSRLFYKSMMLEELANEQAEHRLQTLITYLWRDTEKGGSLDFTRQALADMSGLRVETVIRTIKKMAAAGELKLSRGKIFKI